MRLSKQGLSRQGAMTFLAWCGISTGKRGSAPTGVGMVSVSTTGVGMVSVSTTGVGMVSVSTTGVGIVSVSRVHPYCVQPMLVYPVMVMLVASHMLTPGMVVPVASMMEPHGGTCSEHDLVGTPRIIHDESCDVVHPAAR